MVLENIKHTDKTTDEDFCKIYLTNHGCLSITQSAKEV